VRERERESDEEEGVARGVQEEREDRERVAPGSWGIDYEMGDIL